MTNNSLLFEVASPEQIATSLLASTLDCVKIVDERNRLVYVSTGGCTVLEAESPDALIGAVWTDFWKDSAHRAAADRAIAQARAGSPGRFSGFCPTCKGTPKWWEVLVTPLGTATPARYLLAISRDITAYRAATEELHRSQERLRLMQMAAGIGSWEMDLETGRVSYSPEFAAMLGWPQENGHCAYDDLLGRMYFSTDRENAVAALQRVQRSGKEYRAEFRVMISEEEARWLSSRGKVFYNQGRPLLLGVLIDISGKEERPERARRQAAGR